MSTNLIYNGDFSLPLISTNSSLNSLSLTPAQSTDFYWTCTGNQAAIINGVGTTNTLLNPSLIGYTQSFYILNSNSSIQQSFTVPFAGSYILSFYYSLRTSYPLNNLQILLNGVLIDTVTTTPTNWRRYINTFYNVNIGVNTIKFLGVSVGNYGIVFTGMSFTYDQFGGVQPAPGAALPLTVATYNNFKSTTINGSLNVLDWIPTGGSLVPGTITTQRYYNYNYGTIPNIPSTALGWVISSNVAATTVGALSYTSSFGLTIPTGIYIYN